MNFNSNLNNSNCYNTFTVINECGAEICVTMLYEFEFSEKTFIFYTDYSNDLEGNTKVYTAITNKNDKKQFLLPIETEYDLNIVNNEFKKWLSIICGGEYS